MSQTSSQSATVMPALQMLESTGTLVQAPPPAASSSLVILSILKRKMEPRRWQLGSSDDAEESTVARYNATVAELCENTRSAGPVFPQLGLEPNHAGLASQSLFLLEEFLQSKMQWLSKTFSSSKNDLKEFRAHPNVFQRSQNKLHPLKLKITYQTHHKITCS